MSVNAIKETAKNAAYSALDGGKKFATWSSHKVGDLGGSAKNMALAIVNWVKGFIKNLPQHLAPVGVKLREYAQLFKENPGYSALILFGSAIIGAFAHRLLFNGE